MRFCAEENLHLIADEVYALSVMPADSGEETDEGLGPGFTSVLGISQRPTRREGAVQGEAEGKAERKGEGGEVEYELDRSRIHVVWGLSKDLDSSGVRMVSPSVPLSQSRRNPPLATPRKNPPN